jgi:flavin reductase (DIM6/NTAB) family NADH-FMN oxidoreductase RutF
MMTIDSRAYRNTIGLFATGVTVVCSGQGADVHAMTASAITSLSLHPLLLIFCVKKEARMAGTITRTGRFTVNILTAAQEALSNYFAGLGPEESPPPFSFEPWGKGARLAECAAAISCRLHALHDGGDHWIAVGAVDDLFRAAGEVAPLIYFQGRYARLAQP